MLQKSPESLVEERLSLLKEITERRNVLLRQLYHMIRHGRNVGLVLTLDDEAGDLHTFLRTFELNRESIDSGSILHLSESELFASEDSAVPIKSWSKGKSPIFRRTTRSRFRPQESPLSKSTQSLLRTPVVEGAESGQIAERIPPNIRPLSGFLQYHEDLDEGPDELDLLGSPSTSMLSTQFSNVAHIIDSEAVASSRETLRVSPEVDVGEPSDESHEEGPKGGRPETGDDGNTRVTSGDDQLEERLPMSPIATDLDVDVPIATFSGPVSLIPRSTTPPNDAGPLVEEKHGEVSEDGSEASPLVRTMDSPTLILEPLIPSDNRGTSPQYQQATKSPRSQANLALTAFPSARRPTIVLPAGSSVASEPGFNLEGTVPLPPTPCPPASPVQPRHQFERDYALPSLKLLPPEYNRKVRSAKLQRKREKGREKNEGRRDKDGTKDDWYPLGLNRWAATVNANPVWKRVSRATKCLSTREWAVAMSELRLIRALDRIEGLKREGRWSFRQPKKQRGVGGLNKTHLDYLMDEMKWMRVDFREERKWKMALAFNLSTAVLEWHAAGDWSERVEKGICIGGKRLRSQDDDPEIGDEPVEELKLETGELVQPEQLKSSLLEVDYGSDDDDDDDESVVDQQNVLNALEPAILIQEALDAAQDDGNWTAVQDIQPKAEDLEDSVLVGDGNTNTLMVEKQDTMDVDGVAPDVPKLKATSNDPMLSSNPASRNIDVELSTAQTKSLPKINIYAPLRDHIVYSNDDKLLLGPDDFYNLVDDALLPPSDLSIIFPDLQPLGLFDVPPAIVPSTNDGKKRSERRSERDDPTRRSEDTTYTKLFPAGEFLYSKPTLLGPLHPSRCYKDSRWAMEESAVFPDSDSSARISDNTLSELFDSRSSNSPASIMALQLQAALLKEKDPRKRGADHLWNPSDDALLKSFIDKYPNNWTLISECFNASRLTISIDRRTRRDCLERWKEKWGSEIRQRPTESHTVAEDATPSSSQMTTRGVKRLASVSISTPNTMGMTPGSEPRKRRRHMLVQESIRKAAKKRAESAQKAIVNQRKASAVHETHTQYSKMPKHTPAELSRMKAEKEARDLQDLQMARRRQEELNRQTVLQAHRMNVPEQQQVAQQQLAMTAAQRTNGSIPPTQAVPQIRSQVNISQQRTGTPSMPIGNVRLSPQQFMQAQQQAQQLRTAQQQAQQTQNQAQNNVSGNGPNNAHLPTPHGTRDITSSPAHVSPPHGSTVMPNVVNSPRPPSAQAHALLQVQVPGNAAPRPVPNMGNYYLSEQLQTALRLQMQQQHLQQQQTPQTPPNVFP